VRKSSEWSCWRKRKIIPIQMRYIISWGSPPKGNVEGEMGLCACIMNGGVCGEAGMEGEFAAPGVDGM
jgi:hypothetical protein